MSKCSIIGHRKITTDNNLEKNIYSYMEQLIKNQNVDTFLFGTKSEFNTLCYNISGTLLIKYPFIKRIIYISESETAFLESEKEKWEKLNITNEKFLYFDSIVCIKGNYPPKLNHIKRNFKMIDESDYCIFYFNYNYIPDNKKTLSGTQIAYNFAKKKNKIIKNFY